MIRILSMHELLGKPTSLMLYHGRRLSNPEFLPIRSALKATRTKHHASTKNSAKAESYATLPPAATIDARARSACRHGRKLILAQPVPCKESRSNSSDLRRSAKVIWGDSRNSSRFLPYWDLPLLSSGCYESRLKRGRGSAITELIDLVVRSSLMNVHEIQELKDFASKRYGGNH